MTPFYGYCYGGVAERLCVRLQKNDRKRIYKGSNPFPTFNNYYRMIIIFFRYGIILFTLYRFLLVLAHRLELLSFLDKE